MIIISANAANIPTAVSACINATNAIMANAPTINKLNKSSIYHKLINCVNYLFIKVFYFITDFFTSHKNSQE